ncbi:MAG: hypothetical protein ACFHW5_08815 [Verrucomicrobiota bacterium]
MVLMMAIASAFPDGETRPLDVMASVISVAITIWGMLYLKGINEGFGNQFLCKFFVFAWIVSIKLICIAVPVSIVMAIIAHDFTGKESMNYFAFVFSITFDVIQWIWIGSYIEKTHQLRPSNRPELEALS